MTTKTTTVKTLITLAAMAASLTALTPMMADARPMPMRPAHPAPTMSFHHDRLDPAASARIDARIASLKADIRNGERVRKISLRQGARLTSKVDAVASTKRADSRHGLTFNEAASLNATLDTLSMQVRMASRA